MSRRKLDAYYTPDVLADVLVDQLADHMRPGSTVLEPSVGGGAFASALMERGHTVSVMDIDAGAPGLALEGVRHSLPGDFLSLAMAPRPQWVIGNPPWCEAEKHCRHALKTATRGVAFLLRLAMLETNTRAPFWSEWPASWVYVLSQRASFTGDNHTDNAALAFFVWDNLEMSNRKEWPTRLEVLSWR